MVCQREEYCNAKAQRRRGGGRKRYRGGAERKRDRESGEEDQREERRGDTEKTTAEGKVADGAGKASGRNVAAAVAAGDYLTVLR